MLYFGLEGHPALFIYKNMYLMVQIMYEYTAGSMMEMVHIKVLWFTQPKTCGFIWVIITIK